MVARKSRFRITLILMSCCSSVLLAAIVSPAAAGPADFRALPPLQAGADATTEANGANATASTRHWMVRVQGRPSALASVAAERSGASESAAGEVAVLQADRNEGIQDRVAEAIERRGLAEMEIFRVGTVFNGLAVIADRADAERIEAIDGVVSVEPLPLDEKHNSYSVGAIGAPSVWAPAGGGLTGAGMRIGIIDTGIDYTHTTFGGSGTGDDYDFARSGPANPADPDGDPGDFTVEETGTQIYPSAKVVGGFDFAGDDYDARFAESSTPAPDPNPIDCPSVPGTGRGHGTHVAATAAGYGTTTNGNTYTGGYSSHAPSGFRVGPGVAPEAELFALRVFGCDGSTALTTLAIDWAVDPDRDGDPSDRLDVINLSLGSPFGLPDSAPARAATAASEAGTIVVASAGNSGNQIYQTGSPGSSPRAISVANMVSGFHRDALDIVDYEGQMGYNGRYRANYSNAYDWTANPSVTAELYYPQEAGGNRTGCSPFSQADAAGMSGKIVVLDWRSIRDNPASSFPCGSLARADNAQAAGAVGVIMADSSSGFANTIAGNATIPAAYTPSPPSNILWAVAQFDPGTKVTLDSKLLGINTDLTAAGTVNASSSRGPGALGALKPDLAAPGTDIRSAASGSGENALSLNGTSMAAPHVAGLMALLRQKHPGWSVEELKALAMNTATPDLFTGNGQTGSIHSPQRVGTGTANAPAAVGGRTIAFGVDPDGTGSGRVGVSLGALEVPPGQPFERDFFIKVVNKHDTAVNPFTASFDQRSAPPGVVWSFPDGTQFGMNSGDAHLLKVRLRVEDPAALRNFRETTIAADNNREWIAEASGLVRITDPANASASVPVYASLAPSSSLGTTVDPVRFDGAEGTGSIEFEGSAVSTGGASTLGGGTSNDFNSMRTPLELQHTSPPLSPAPGAPANLAAADLKHVGASYEATWNELTFGFSLRGNLPALSGFGGGEVVVDSDRDGDDDFTIAAERLNFGAGNTDSFRTVVRDTTPQENIVNLAFPPFVTAFPFAGRAFDTDVHTLTVLPAWLGLEPGSSSFNYRVRTFSQFVSGVADQTPTLTYDYLNEGVSFAGESIQDDRPGTLDYSWDADNMAANGTSGTLIFHHMNQTGERDEVIPMQVERVPELTVEVPASVPEGRLVGLGATATDANDDPLSFSWDLGDGNGFSVSSATASFTPDDGPATRVVQARVTDGRNDPVVREAEVQVLNVAPVVTAPPKVESGTAATWTATDPSAADRSAGYTWKVDVGADGSIEREVSGSEVLQTTLELPPGDTAVRVTATDKDGGISNAVTTNGVGPQTGIRKARISKVKVSGPNKVKRGKKATYKVRISNSGNIAATGVKLRVKGKGISFSSSVGKVAAGKARTIRIKLKPAKSGQIRASFKVTSKNAGSKTAKKKITVRK